MSVSPALLAWTLFSRPSFLKILPTPLVSLPGTMSGSGGAGNGDAGPFNDSGMKPVPSRGRTVTRPCAVDRP